MVTGLLALWLVLPGLTPVTPPQCTPLQLAARAGDLETVRRLGGRRLLGFSTTVSALEATGTSSGPCAGRTPLMLAAEHGQLEAARLMISSGAQLDAAAVLPEYGDRKFDALCLAIANRKPALVALLEKAGARAQGCSADAQLFAAVALDSTSNVEQELRALPGRATLQQAIERSLGKNARALPLLVAAGVKAELPFAALYEEAIVSGNLRDVLVLEAGGARLTGGAELALAISNNALLLIQPLIRVGASTDNPEVRAAVVEALRAKQGGVLTTLIEAGYRGDDEVPLLVEAVVSMPELAPRLIKAGVGIEVDDEQGLTPLMAAAQADNQAIVALLLKRGASARTADLGCRTAPLGVTNVAPAPGRAATRRGITCGLARATFKFRPEKVRVFIDQAELPLEPMTVYRFEPGAHLLRVVDQQTGVVKQVPLPLRSGENHRDLH